MKIRKNRILEKSRHGRKALGVNMAFPCAESLELIGMTGGFDYVYLDGEHGIFSPESIDSICRIADGFGLTVIARVPDIQPSTIIRFLDRGVIGVQGPHVETREHVQALVDACRFAPDGNRSWGGGRGTYYNDTGLLEVPGSERTEFMAQANKEMFVMAQLETATAFENLDAILEVEGIDAFTWGSNDLAQSMGYPGQPEHPAVLEAQEKAAKRIHTAGRKMSFDIMKVVRLHSLILDGARKFLAENR